VCGLDFATGELPDVPPAAAPADPATAAWAVVIEVDADFFARNRSENESLTLPAATPAREVPLRGQEALVGRKSESANVHPDIDLGSDPGVSRRHALFTRRSDGTWTVTDQGSTNGTSVGGRPIPAGEAVEVVAGSEIHVGAWTRLTLLQVDT
jgi:pSer/pThr/pTyr-binding forkhead associated (FHA) protein